MKSRYKKPNRNESNRKADEPFFSKTKSHASKDAIQPKLKIGKTDDPAEKEADAMAQSVVKQQSKKNGGDSNEIQRQSAKEEEVQTKSMEEEEVQTKSQEEEEVQTKSAEEEEVQAKSQDEEEVQTKSEEEEVQTKMIHLKADNSESNYIFRQKKEATQSNVVPPEVEANLESTKGQGMPLPLDIRNEMEESFQADFSKVRIHTGSMAVQMTRSLNALAFTNGYDIYFNEGKYNPESPSGKELLAHELTHVVQQKGK